jgi:hypothetical protein
MVHHRRPFGLRVRAKEDRGDKYSLERSNQAAILGAPLLHPENIEHFRCAAEGNGLFLLPYGQRGQENGNQPVLAPRQPVGRVPGHLQEELPVPAFVQ